MGSLVLYWPVVSIDLTHSIILNESLLLLQMSFTVGLSDNEKLQDTPKWTYRKSHSTKLEPNTSSARLDVLSRVLSVSFAEGKKKSLSLFSRRFIKTHWTNTQNTNKKMTIHWFHSIAIQHKYQNHNTALSSLSVNARHTSASLRWNVGTNASHAVHLLQQRCLLPGSFFSNSFWSQVNKHVHTLLSYFFF